MNRLAVHRQTTPQIRQCLAKLVDEHMEQLDAMLDEQRLVVWLPKRRILFGGCLVLTAERPGNVADADLVAWPESVRRLASYRAKVVIPGHGDRTDPGLIEHTVEAVKRAR